MGEKLFNINDKESQKPERREISREEYERLGAEWRRLNLLYDAQIEGIIDNPTAVSASQLEEMKRSQQRLWDVEDVILRVGSGKMQMKG